MEIYYKVHTEWCKYPFNDVVDERYCEFFYKLKKKFIKLHSLKMESNTTIEEKLKYLKENYSEKVTKIIRIK